MPMRIYVAIFPGVVHTVILGVMNGTTAVCSFFPFLMHNWERLRNFCHRFLQSTQQTFQSFPTPENFLTVLAAPTNTAHLPAVVTVLSRLQSRVWSQAQKNSNRAYNSQRLRRFVRRTAKKNHTKEFGCCEWLVFTQLYSQHIEKVQILKRQHCYIKPERR